MDSEVEYLRKKVENLEYLKHEGDKEIGRQSKEIEGLDASLVQVSILIILVGVGSIILFGILLFM